MNATFLQTTYSLALMQYQEHPPPAALARHLRCFWTLDAPRGGGAPAPALPDGYPELIVNLGDLFEAHGTDGRVVPQPRVMLVGQITRPFPIAPTGSICLVAARFTPAGAMLLHRPMSSITDTWADVADLFPDLLVGTDRDQVLAALGDALIRLVVCGRAPSDLVLRTITHVDESDGATPIAEIAATLGTTPRQLQRRFREEVGITPKLLARLRRFHRVLATWRDEPGRWASVAVSCGYYDQAHLVRDFTELGGGAPAALLASLPEFTRLFTPLGRS